MCNFLEKVDENFLSFFVTAKLLVFLIPAKFLSLLPRRWITVVGICTARGTYAVAGARRHNGGDLYDLRRSTQLYPKKNFYPKVFGGMGDFFQKVPRNRIPRIPRIPDKKQHIPSHEDLLATFSLTPQAQRKS